MYIFSGNFPVAYSSQLRSCSISFYYWVLFFSFLRMILEMAMSLTYCLIIGWSRPWVFVLNNGYIDTCCFSNHFFYSFGQFLSNCQIYYSAFLLLISFGASKESSHFPPRLILLSFPCIDIFLTRKIYLM